MDLGDVFDAAGSFCEAMDGPEGDAPLSEGTAEEVGHCGRLGYFPDRARCCDVAY